MTIYLIRHGKTEANEKHLYCGSTDLSLSVAGREELQNIRYDIKNVRFITSGMKRTNETLQMLFGDVPYEVEPRFREVDFGIFEMHSYDQLKDTEEYQAWLAGDNDINVPPKGESGEQMKARVLEALSEIKDDTCIITHGGVIASIMECLFSNEGKNRYQWQPKPGRGYAIEIGVLTKHKIHSYDAIITEKY
jgi:alpha-ribazole phosphatase